MLAFGRRPSPRPKAGDHRPNLHVTDIEPPSQSDVASADLPEVCRWCRKDRAVFKQRAGE